MKRIFSFGMMLLCIKLLSADVLPTDTVLVRFQNYLQRGDSCEKQYNTFQALEWYQKAMTIHPTPTAFRRVAQSHYKRGHYRQGLRVNQRIAEDSVNHQDMKYRYNCYANLNQVDSAVWWGEQIIQRYPYDSDIVANLAQYYIGEDNPAQALIYTLSYNKIDSTNIFVNRQQAYAYYSMEDFNRALTAYKRLVEQDDHSFLTLYCLGLCYAKADDLNHAYNYLLEAVKLKEYKHANSLAHLGMLCVQMQNPIEGVGYIQKSIELISPDAKLLYTLYNSMATGYLQKLDYANSLRCLKECARYNSDALYTLFKIAQIYGYQKDTVHEKQYYQEFVERAAKQSKNPNGIAMAIESAQHRLREIKEDEFFRKGSK